MCSLCQPLEFEGEGGFGSWRLHDQLADFDPVAGYQQETEHDEEDAQDNGRVAHDVAEPLHEIHQARDQERGRKEGNGQAEGIETQEIKAVKQRIACCGDKKDRREDGTYAGGPAQRKRHADDKRTEETDMFLLRMDDLLAVEKRYLQHAGHVEAHHDEQDAAEAHDPVLVPGKDAAEKRRGKAERYEHEGEADDKRDGVQQDGFPVFLLRKIAIMIDGGAADVYQERGNEGQDARAEKREKACNECNGSIDVHRLYYLPSNGLCQMRHGAIDIGSNAVLLLVMEDGDHPKEILDTSTITRLGEGVLGTGLLSDAAMERTTLALEGYRTVLDRHGVHSTRCFATAAVREAGNRETFIAMAGERAGLTVEVFSEYQEARYTYLSVRSDPAIQGEDLLIIDIGGGSTEIIKGTRDAFVDYVSIPVGTVKLTELFIAHDPPLPEELECLVAYVQDRIDGLVHAGNAAVVGMAGTMTTLAAMVLGVPFDKEKVHGMNVSAALLEEWIARLGRMTIAERKVLPGMEAGREDLLLQGMVLMREIMRACGASSFSVSTYGARYGVIYEATGRT